MSVRWCFVASHEITDDTERMVMTPGGSHICVPCSQTERGKRVMIDPRDRHVIPSRYVGSNWSRMYAAMGSNLKKRHGG